MNHFSFSCLQSWILMNLFLRKVYQNVRLLISWFQYLTYCIWSLRPAITDRYPGSFEQQKQHLDSLFCPFFWGEEFIICFFLFLSTSGMILPQANVFFSNTCKIAWFFGSAIPQKPKLVFSTDFPHSIRLRLLSINTNRSWIYPPTKDSSGR